MAILANRMASELKLLERDPPPGACAWPLRDSITELRATILGPEGTVYEHGSFSLSISVPDRYIRVSVDPSPVAG